MEGGWVAHASSGCCLASDSPEAVAVVSVPREAVESPTTGAWGSCDTGAAGSDGCCA